jgi:hypothetical protein
MVVDEGDGQRGTQGAWVATGGRGRQAAVDEGDGQRRSDGRERGRRAAAGALGKG